MNDTNRTLPIVPDAGGPPGPTAGPAAFLISLNPALVHREYQLNADRTLVGRNADCCDIVCSGATISRRHFQVRRAGESEYILEDLNSTNGVFLNRQRLQGSAKLTEGDLIGIGSDSIDHLRFQQESGANRSWTMDLPPKDAWTIGRSPHCDVALAFESTVSWQHALVRPKGSRVELVDPRSLNGTWLNGRRIRKALLEPTDSIMIGSTILRFEPLAQGALRVVRRDSGGEIALECIGLTRDVRGGAKRILDAVNLSIRPGEFVGLLGPSGAGKSTLLKALNAYNPPTYGCVLLNETPLFPFFDMFRNSIGYVPQDDIVHPELTVAKSLDYVARLRLPPDVTSDQRHDLIDSTLETLGLAHVHDSRISDLSGGQRKRVSIGCELITRPSLLFLDEPTSGMDPSTEERLMRHFQGLARRGTTILITTHILYNLDLLDRVVIMSRGRLAFFGTPQEALQFFSIKGNPIDRATQIFEILEGEHIESTAGPGDPKNAVAEEYQRKYIQSDLFRRHVANTYSGLAWDLFTTSHGPCPGATRETTQAAPHSSDAKRCKNLLEKPTAGSRKGFRFDLCSLRSFLTLARRNLAIKLVSPKRALFYLAVPLVLALVTLSLRTSDFPDDAEMEQKRAEISEGLQFSPGADAGPKPGATGSPFSHAAPTPSAAGSPFSHTAAPSASMVPGAMGPVDLGPAIKKLLAPDAPEDQSAEDVVFAMKYEGLPNLPTPLSVLLMFVMTSVFMGTLMACLDLSTERPVYVRERMANQKIADYLGSKLPFLLAVTALQCALFLGLCWLKPGLRQFHFPSAYLAMVAMAWTSCAMGLFLSAADPTPGQFSVILAIVMVLPQLVFSGGLGPDFYAGMTKPMAMLANAFPARWGLEMLMTAFYHHPDRSSLDWIADFVPDIIGFGFGPRVYLTNVVVLTLQALAWLGLCSLALKRLDRAR